MLVVTEQMVEGHLAVIVCHTGRIIIVAAVNANRYMHATQTGIAVRGVDDRQCH